MAWDEAVLRARARRAYERGRLIRALPWGAWAVPGVVLGLLAGNAPVVAWSLAVGLAALIVGLRWWGRGADRGVPTGLVAGVVGFVLPLAVIALHVDGCSTTTCVSTCLSAGAAGGVAAGAGIGLHTLRSGEGTAHVVGAAAVAAVIASLACMPVGVVGVVGLVVGLGATTAVLVAPRALRA